MYTPKKRLILEGPDLAGKSTVGIMLEAITGLELLHFGGPPKTAKKLWKRVAQYDDHPTAILDRHTCISEIVYGGVLRGGVGMLIQAPEMYQTIQDIDPIIIYCSVPPEYVEERFRFMMKADKPYKSTDHRNQIRIHYRSLWLRYHTIMQIFKRSDICVLDADFRTVTTKDLEARLRIFDHEYK